LLLGGEADGILGMVVRVSFPWDTLFRFVPGPPDRARSSRFVPP